MDETWTKKFRIVTIALVFSGALNIGLIAAFAAVHMQNNADLGSVHKEREAPLSSNAALLETLQKLSFRELVALLTNREQAEEGYAKRDLAISALVAFHHFNLEKALSSSQLQKRPAQLADGREIELYPGLTEEQFEAVIRFAYQEKFPLTGEGMFTLLKKLSTPRDEQLEQAFLLTPEVYALQALFQTTNTPQPPAALINLVVEGNWALLSSFAKEQAENLDLSAEKRRSLLLAYLRHRSPTAAQILLKTDAQFALKQLDDAATGELLTQLNQKSEEGVQFCISLLQSPRSDAIWKQAVEKLYAWAGESLPEPFNLRTAASRFASLKGVPEEVHAPAKTQAEPRRHVVQDGESLWKISRQYKVKVEEIARFNNLQNDRVFPGMTLQIPD